MNKTTKKSLLQRGFVHIQTLVMAVLVIGGIAAVGSYVIFKSNAAVGNPVISIKYIVPYMDASGSFISSVKLSWGTDAPTAGGQFRLALVDTTTNAYYDARIITAPNNGKTLAYSATITPSASLGKSIKASVSYRATPTSTWVSEKKSDSNYYMINGGSTTPTPIVTPTPTTVTGDIPEKDVTGGTAYSAAEENAIFNEIDAMTGETGKTDPMALPKTPRRLKVLTIAKREAKTGACEGSSKVSDYQKYGCGYTGAAWCAAFVSWVYDKALDNSPNLKSCSVSNMIALAKRDSPNNNQFREYGTPLPGEIIGWHYKPAVTDRPGHVGIFVKVDKQTGEWVTIDGNYSGCVKLVHSPKSYWTTGDGYGSNAIKGIITP